MFKLPTKPTKPDTISGSSIVWDCKRTDDIKHEADEAVVACERNEDRLDEDDVLEVVDDRFAVQEVVGYDEEVPRRQQGRECN